mmetsp:Transcript_47124/g.123672  ORF Transcript_47124/g.123672 Transcript_47124/m.123672 type:complete len:202 (+) Transcript_47124:632-1237(+)
MYVTSAIDNCPRWPRHATRPSHPRIRSEQTVSTTGHPQLASWTNFATSSGVHRRLLPALARSSTATALKYALSMRRTNACNGRRRHLRRELASARRSSAGLSVNVNRPRSIETMRLPHRRLNPSGLQWQPNRQQSLHRRSRTLQWPQHLLKAKQLRQRPRLRSRPYEPPTKWSVPQCARKRVVRCMRLRAGSKAPMPRYKT